MTIWTDICVNLTHKRFDKDREDVLNDAFSHGIRRLIVTGTNIEHSLKAIHLCEQHPRQLRCTAGCHPHDANEMRTDSHWLKLESFLASPFVVAIGECGLDFDRNFSEPSKQIEVFIRQLELAEKYDLAVFIHERSAHQEMLSILQEYRPKLSKVVIHCFTSSEEELKNYLELDLYIGLTGWVCDERRNQSLVKAIPLIPNDRLLIETDAPFLLPKSEQKPRKKGRNEPQLLLSVAEKIAQIRQMNIKDLATITTLNSADFFNWPLDIHSIN